MVWRSSYLCHNEMWEYMLDMNEICQEHREGALMTGISEFGIGGSISALSKKNKIIAFGVYRHHL
jgi:hypothetical protein